MRSHYFAELPIQENYILKGDDLHHLVNVVRIEADEEILLGDGRGLQVFTKVESITKKELRLKFIRQTQAERSYLLDVLIGIPKKEALELCLKQATELGIRKVFLVRSQYSQQRVPEKDRLQALLVSALEQSNCPFLPEIQEVTWEAAPWENYAELWMMDSQSEKGQINDSRTAEKLLLVGPEGGWSPEEITFLHSKSHVRVLRLPTPILRTPTALAAGVGFLLGRLMD